jgi:hypothetical protein
MALTKIAKTGYGQLELNFAAFRRNGAIEAQCKMADGIDYLENGMLLVVDRKNRKVCFPGTEGVEGPIALNYTAEHMYDEREQALKDFKLDNHTFLPRLGYIGVADKFTTNTVCYEEGEDLKGFKYGKPCKTEGFGGYIELTNDKTDAVVEVIKVTDMPDGQVAIQFAGMQK